MLGTEYLLREFRHIESLLTDGSKAKEELQLIRVRLTDTDRNRPETPPLNLASISEENTPIQLLPRLAYEVPWQLPVAADLCSMRQLAASLQHPADQANVEHGLQFLKTACDDLPGEYFLQPPYIVLVCYIC